jgi:tight adherence protein C
MNSALVIPALAAVSTVSLGGALVAARALRQAPLRARIRALRGELPDPDAFVPEGTGVSDLMGGLGNWFSSGKVSHNLRTELTQAGFPGRSAAAIYLGVKALLAAIGFLASASAVVPASYRGSTKMIIIFASTAVLFFIPNVVVYARRSRRCGEIRRFLPDAIDLLEICVSAGMGMDMAWNSVADEVREVSPVLADEMALTNLEIHLGETRAVAMRSMARRTGADELSSLVAVLVQSERFGTSIIDALRTFASSMRETRSMRSQEDAEKMGIKLIFPMILFIFPAVVIVMAGPAGISLYHALAAK